MSGAQDIKDNAGKPKRASGDGISSEQHSISEQILADKFHESKQVVRAKNPLAGMIRQVRPPGASGQ